MKPAQIQNPIEALETLRMATEAADIGIWDLDLASGELNWSDTHLCGPVPARNADPDVLKSSGNSNRKGC